LPVGSESYSTHTSGISFGRYHFGKFISGVHSGKSSVRSVSTGRLFLCGSKICMDSSMDMATQVTTFRMKSIWEMINQDIMMRRPMAKAVTTKPVTWRRTWQVAFSQKRLEKEEEALSTDPGHAAFHSLDADRRGRRPPVKRSAFFLMGLALRLLVIALSLPQDLSRIIVYMPSSEFPGSRLHNLWRLVFRGVTLAI